MYILGQELSVEWNVVGEHSVEMPLSYFDVIVTRPDGTHPNHLGVLYLDTEASGTLFVGPKLAYKFTPDIKGVWQIKLTSGNANVHTVYNVRNFSVNIPDTHAYQQVTLKSASVSMPDVLAGTLITEID